MHTIFELFIIKSKDEIKKNSVYKIRLKDTKNRSTKIRHTDYLSKPPLLSSMATNYNVILSKLT